MASGPVNLSQYSSYAAMIAATGQQAQTATSAFEALGHALDTAVQRMNRAGLGEYLDKVNNSVATLGNTLLNLAKAGLQGTAEGNRLAFSFTLLSRQIASVFLPIINALSDGIRRLTAWFQGLSGDSQHIAMMIGGVAIAFATLGPIVGKLLGALSPTAIAIAMLVEGVMLWLTGTQEGQMVLKGLGEIFEWFNEKIGGFSEVFRVVADAVVVACQGIVRGIAWVAIKISSIIEELLSWVPMMGDAVNAMREWRVNAEANLQKMMDSGWGLKPGSQKPRDKSQVNPVAGTFESLSASWERVMSQANKQDGTADFQKKTLDKQERMIKGIEEVRDKVGETRFGSSGGGDF